MEIIDNVNKTLKEDLTTEIHKGSKVSIAAACFSIYAFAELKKELKNVDELRFIFTSPTFIKEKAKCEKREFYIPRQEREKNLFGSEFEVKLRNEMTQKAIAKECAEWIRKKAVFKSNVTNENMMGYKYNYINNPIAADRMRYDVLFHTDLSRESGNSNGMDLDMVNWGNYDLVVIDESHNFRNGGKISGEDEKENRYLKLLNKVIRKGVKTKVLMLSATPVNNRFVDLKNQIALAYEGESQLLDEKLNTHKSIDDIFKQAQTAFNTWSKWEPEDRTTSKLLRMLDFDFFELLDSVTIARSRKHMIDNGNETKVPSNDLNDNFYKKEFQTLWGYINHKYAYTVSFDSNELIKKAIDAIDAELYVSTLQYTTSISEQKDTLSADAIKSGDSFKGAKSDTTALKHFETSQIKYDLIGKVAEATVLTRRTVAAILKGIRKDKFDMYKNNPEEFISKVTRLIKEQKATMIVDHISYDQLEGKYDSEIFTAEKHTTIDKAFKAEKHIQPYVFTDGNAEKSVERKFAEDLDGAAEVCVYAKLPKGFSIPTPVGNYSPDWAIAFNEGTVKHIFFVAETKGTMESLQLRPIEKAKIMCARRLFNEISTDNVVYHDVDSYQSLLNIMNDPSLDK